MEDAVIVATARTPIGRAVKGSLKDERADDLAGFIIADLMGKVPEVDGADVEDVICGVANATGQQSRNLGRLAGQLGGLPNTVPGTTVQRACASSLQAIRVAAHAIRAGEGDIFVSAGVEAVSQFYEPQDPGNPRFMDETRSDYLDDFYIPMGMTAENVADAYDVSRSRMDEFAKISQDRAVAARDRMVRSDHAGASVRPGRRGRLSRCRGGGRRRRGDLHRSDLERQRRRRAYGVRYRWRREPDGDAHRRVAP
jgi:acetyl-CoA C-acetyltransferase